MAGDHFLCDSEKIKVLYYLNVRNELKPLFFKSVSISFHRTSRRYWLSLSFRFSHVFFTLSSEQSAWFPKTFWLFNLQIMGIVDDTMHSHNLCDVVLIIWCNVHFVRLTSNLRSLTFHQTSLSVIRFRSFLILF